MRTPIKPSWAVTAGTGVLAHTGAAFTNSRPKAPNQKSNNHNNHKGSKHQQSPHLILLSLSMFKCRLSLSPNIREGPTSFWRRATWRNATGVNLKSADGRS